MRRLAVLGLLLTVVSCRNPSPAASASATRPGEDPCVALAAFSAAYADWETRWRVVATMQDLRFSSAKAADWQKVGLYLNRAAADLKALKHPQAIRLSADYAQVPADRDILNATIRASVIASEFATFTPKDVADDKAGWDDVVQEVVDTDAAMIARIAYLREEYFACSQP